MESKFPRAFSFDGENVSFDTLSNHNWKADIKIRPYNSIMTVYGIQKEAFKIECQISKKSLPVLKSNLQKCVRRKDEARAIRTALAMYSFNPNEILRRLCIVMIEDCLPYPKAFINLVWWMCAVSKGYIMSKAEVETMLGIVATLCESEEYEIFNSRLKGHKPGDWSDLPNSSFFWALELRKIYGGMSCDVEMLSYHQELWMDRFRANYDKWEARLLQTDYVVEIESADKFSKDDLLLESIDYHPFPFIPQKIADKVSEISLDEIRLAIWMCRSRTNFRKPIDPDPFTEISARSKSVYNMIESELLGFTKWLKQKLELSSPPSSMASLTSEFKD